MVVAAVTLWGSRLIVMVDNISGGGGGMDTLNNQWQHFAKYWGGGEIFNMHACLGVCLR